MIDKLIASDLAALAHEDHQRIPAFALPAPRPKPARHMLTWASIVTVAPALTMFVAGMVLMAFQVAPFAHYEPFVPPFVVAIVSLVGLALAYRPKPVNVRLRVQVAYLFTGTALVIAAGLCFYARWPSPDAMYVVTTDDTLYMSTWIGGPAPYAGVGFIVIAATLGVVVSRRIAARLNLNTSRDRRVLDAWSTSAMIIGVLVVVIWTSALDFEQRYWPLVHWRLPDLSYRNNIPQYIQAEMWFALRFRPWSESLISPEQANVAAAGVAIVAVALATAVAIVREGRSGRSFWLRFMELPVLAPLFIFIGTANLARATVADGPDQAARPFAWAVVGVMLAFTSMILRRRRRREALS